MGFRADLHVHSNCSDGLQTPKELLELAKEANLSGLSITDHDSIKAYDDALFAYADELGIRLLTGVEFSCRHEEKVVHVLGYGFDCDSKPLNALCERHIERRKNRNLSMLDRLKGKGIEITYEEVEAVSEGVMGRPHIAQVLVQKGVVKSVKDGFDRYLGDKKPCYVTGDTISVVETIDVIHQAGGKAFVAHPHLAKDTKFVKRLLQLKFDGIECYYAKFAPSKELPWIELAMKHELLISGGSDFHGSIKPLNSLGCSWVDEERFNAIIL